MSETKTVTEREAVLRERRAWDECAYRLSLVGMGSAESEKLKNELYPLPKITRLREVPDPHKPTTVWRCAERTLQFRFEGMAWQDAHTTQSTHRTHIDWPTPKRIALWADLLANPTEEVTE